MKRLQDDMLLIHIAHQAIFARRRPAATVSFPAGNVKTRKSTRYFSFDRVDSVIERHETIHTKLPDVNIMICLSMREWGVFWVRSHEVVVFDSISGSRFSHPSFSSLLNSTKAKYLLYFIFPHLYPILIHSGKSDGALPQLVRPTRGG